MQFWCLDELQSRWLRTKARVGASHGLTFWSLAVSTAVAREGCLWASKSRQRNGIDYLPQSLRRRATWKASNRRHRQYTQPQNRAIAQAEPLVPNLGTLFIHLIIMLQADGTHAVAHMVSLMTVLQNLRNPNHESASMVGR